MSSTVLVIGESVEFIYCVCKCGSTRPKYDSQGRERKFIDGHQMIGRIFTEEHLKNISKGQTGHKNHNFGKPMSEEQKLKIGLANRGKDLSNGNPTYRALHKRIRKKLPKPGFCHLCLKVPPREVACITGIYNDELRNWAWFCRPCHNKWDNIGIRNKIKRVSR